MPLQETTIYQLTKNTYMKKLLTLSLCSLTFLAVQATTPLWLRDVAISPDGNTILFCYKGDIYKVNANGGEAQQLTSSNSFDSNPVWSPDGKKIAFASDRFGNTDVMIMSAEGGQATQLTTHTGKELPWAFTTDGKNVVFSASIQDQATSILFPSANLTELYSVPVEGGRIHQMLQTPAEAICYNSDGSAFVYQDKKGGEDEWRKHHTSSITRDIWFYDSTTKTHKNLTKHAGEDRNPVLSADGQTVFMLSERDGGTFNVYSFPLSQPNKLTKVSNFSTHPVRFLSMSRSGRLCYTYDGEIYTQETAQAQPKKVNISITRDDVMPIEHLTFTSGVSSATVSPDGKQVAFVARGDIFVTSTDYSTTKRISKTPQAEATPSFSPDGRTIAYATERTGIWQLVLAKIVRKEDPNFSNATLVEEEILLPSDDIERTHPKFSPDGKELAFIEGRRKLMVVNLATKAVRQITDESTCNSSGANGFNYTWSPDGKWFAVEFVDNHHDPYSDIGLVSSAGDGSKITNLTGSGYFCESPRFVLDGKAILFISDRYGMRAHASWGSQNDAFLVFLNQDAYDRYRLSEEDYALLKELEKKSEKKDAAKDNKKVDMSKKDNDKKDEDTEKKDVKPIVVELDGIEDRVVRLTPNSSNLGDAILSSDGETLYYLAAFEKGYDIWKMDLRKGETKLINKANGRWSSMNFDKDGKTLFLLGGNSMQKMDISGTQLKPISFKAEMDLDLAAEREYMFNHVYLQEKKRFYNTNMHGVDWEAMAESYRKFLPHINNRHDFAELLSEILGELNVSHTGGRFRPSVPTDKATANLGLFFDWNYEGDGLMISEVLEKGPFHKAKSTVKAGVIVEKIDGETITANTDPFPLLVGKTGKKTLVSLYNPETGKRWEEVILPISPSKTNSLLYDRWVKQRAADVERLSNGRLGYVHIESMNDGSFRTIYSDILGKYNQKEGIVIDTRFNGGGRLHEDVEVLFSGKKYLTQVVRGDEACDMPSRRWNKPSIMITCEANYSNAHGTPWVYQHMNLGKVVGMPVPGTMTSVSWETLQDPQLIFGIPVTGYRTAEGYYLENHQLEPDVKIANAPEDVERGEDMQLRVAVEELLKQIDKH